MAIASFSPTSAYAGQTVNIVGANFLTGGTTGAVTFGGVDAASFVIVDDGHINAVVGAGGATGDVGAYLPGGFSSKSGFTFLGSVTGSGKVTQSGGVLTFTDTSTGITVTTRVLNIYDCNGNLLQTITMGTNPVATYTIMTDQYLTFVCTLNGFTTITVNWLSTYFYDTAYTNIIAQLGCCSTDKLSYYDISQLFRTSAVTLAMNTEGAAAQNCINTANYYING